MVPGVAVVRSLMWAYRQWLSHNQSVVAGQLGLPPISLGPQDCLVMSSKHQGDTLGSPDDVLQAGLSISSIFTTQHRNNGK